MNYYELEPRHESRRSYYGKAWVIIHDDGRRSLVSYQTRVMTYDPETGKLTRLWDGWSATTGRHIKEFALQMSGRWIDKNAYFEL